MQEDKPFVYLALAFDHELSLGQVTASFAANLFDPTEELLDTADSCGVPITLFTDALSGLKFEEWGVPRYFEAYTAQLQSAIRRGHDVQLHLHPHWIESSYGPGGFVPSQKYSLGCFATQAYPNDIWGIVERAARYLTQVCAVDFAKYRCCAFRAGGLSISPSTREIVAALLGNGIQIDSSIAKGYRFDSTANVVDFSNVPEAANWYLSPDTPLHMPAREGLLEVPIVAIPRTPANNLPALMQRVFYSSRAPRATGKPLYEVTPGALRSRLARLFPRSCWMLSFDYYYKSPGFLLRLLSRYIDRFPGETTIVASTLSHPKAMGKASFRLMREFVGQAKAEYGPRLRFCTFRDIADRICASSQPTLIEGAARGPDRGSETVQQRGWRR